MPAVSNTSPILNLAIIHRLDLLQNQFGQLLIPSAVLDELRAETALPGTEAIRQGIQDGWIREMPIQDPHLQNALALELDQGEAAAIALALESGITKILLDERDGRAKAKALGLEPVGVLGVLLCAKRNGTLESVRDAMQMLRQDAGFYIGDELLGAILAEAGERL